MNITSDIFEAFLKCPTKCFFSAHGEVGTGNLYADWVRTENESYRKTCLARSMEGFAHDEVVIGTRGGIDVKEVKLRLAVDFMAQAPGIETRLHAVERIPPQACGKPTLFIPIRFIFRNKLGADDKLLLAFDAFALSSMLGRVVSVGKIIHGDDRSTLRVKLEGLRHRVEKLTGRIVALLAAGTPPDLMLNRHCTECEFQTRCQQKALEKEDLSLLASMSEKKRKKYHSKGIFTVTQLSYTFRPRRRPKRLRDKRERYHYSLKALAVRERKIHIVGTPELKIDGTPVYLDVEGLPDRDFYYLIGVRIGNGESAVQHSLWADSVADEGTIWRAFLGLLETVEKPVLIHYGSYETVFFMRMCKRYGEIFEGTGPAKAVDSALNLVSFLFAQIYFPTHSNALKHIGAWLGCKWSSTAPSGTDSIIWRMNWEQSSDPSVKQNLIAYNSDDCRALDVLTETLLRICSPDHRPEVEGGADPEVALADTSTTRDALWRRFSSPITGFQVINRAARWDYQRDRVYLRTGKFLKRTALARKSRVRRAVQINKVVNCQDLEVCPFCGRKPDMQFRKRPNLLYDIRFTRFGLRRWVVKYRFRYYWCASCHKRFGRPEEFWPQSIYGRNLVVLIVYETIELCVPQNTVKERLSRLFGLGLAISVVYDLKASAAGYYMETRQKIFEHIIKGKLIHADETPIPLKDRHGYVWVFATFHEVVYFYAETREGDLLREMLKRFRGVIVSDFYTAYDSLPCPQQKCLLHLMRDLNEAVLDYPYDEELKQIAMNFAKLLKGIVDTIDRWGLKRRFLRKHLLDVDRFYRQVSKTAHQSEVTLKWKERFEKNRDKLFTFLIYDGVPWNNNNAEHAIKAFARLRRVIVGLSSPKGIEDYLILLSVCQTCKYMGVDFLDFLRSGEKDIHAFAESRRVGRRRPPTG